jgi:hypothetical protein
VQSLPARFNKPSFINQYATLNVTNRYTDVHFQFEKSGLVAGFVKSVNMHGMQLTEFSLHGHTAPAK